MSHITRVKTVFRHLDALKEAGAAVGLDFMENQKTHIWAYGRNRTNACEHAFRLKDHRKGDDEIGIVKAENGDGYQLQYDGYGQARLMGALGIDGRRFKQEYSKAVSLREARKVARRGFKIHTPERLANGRIGIRLTAR